MASGRVCPQHSSRPAASVITKALTVLARALPKNESAPTGPTGGRTAHPNLGGIQQADPPAGPQVGHHIGQGAQPDLALHGAAALGQQRADLPDRSGNRGTTEPSPVS
jgi:hypothetical protein